MIEAIRRLALGVLLLVLAGGVLLYMDRPNARSSGDDHGGLQQIRVALVQHASLDVFEQGAAGALEELAARGYSDGGRLRIRRYNAEGDIGTANAIAREVTSGNNDLIISMSTVSLQTIANANKNGARTNHVFGLVSDPYSAGVGIDPANHLDHPPYLAGSGCIQPVEQVIRTARRMRPELKSIGLVWNPAEANSLAQTVIARKVCSEMGIDLVEGNADNSSAVLESAQAVISRGAECMWISGDVTVNLATEQLVEACRRARIPVITVMPPTVSSGALFDLGANYYEIGKKTGSIAADVLDGKKPSEIPVDNYVPELFLYNETALTGLRDRWEIPADLKQKANGFITATTTDLAVLKQGADSGPKPGAAGGPAPGTPGRKARVDVVEYLETPNVEINRKGIIDGLAKAGLVDGRDLELRIRNAQGDMAALNTIMDATASDGTDLLITATTPALQAALQRAGRRPVVFSLVANPMVAGAGRSEQDHLPNVTGAYVTAPHQEGLEALRLCLPGVRRIGTLFVPAEVNSVYYKDELVKAARALGIEVELVGVSSSGEISDAAMALCSRDIEAVCQISDNLTGASFASIAQAARRARLPLLGFASGQATSGAFMTVSRDFYDGGLATAGMAARVLRGESPAGMPFQPVATIRYVFNTAAAAEVGITIPEELLQLGDTVP